MLSVNHHREGDIMKGTVRIMAGVFAFVAANGWFYNGYLTTQELIVLALGGLAVSVWGLKDGIQDNF